MGSFGHRLVIGPGGSGTSHRLAGWLAELHERIADGSGSLPSVPDVVEARGDPVVPPAPGVVERLRAAIVSGDALVVAHDVHWLPEPVVIELVHAADRLDVWASRRPWPVSDLVRTLDDRLTSARPADRLGPLTVDELAPVVAHRTGRAAVSALVDELHEAVAGFVGPACDALDEGWVTAVGRGDDAPLPDALRDRLLRRVGRAGAAAAAYVRVLTVDPALDPALADRLAVELVPGAGAGVALRAANAGGLLGPDGRVVPLVARAVRDDMTEAERAEMHGRLAEALATVDRGRAVDHAVAGAVRTGGHLDDLLAAARAVLVTDPTRATELVERAHSAGADPTRVALLDAELHLRAGRSDALTALGRIGDPEVPELALEAARLRTAAELRAGRWDRVARVDVDDAAPASGVMRRLAELLVLADRVTEPSPATRSAARSPITRLLDALVDALEGRRVEALRRAVEAADDEVTGSDEQFVGVGVSLLAALLALTLGELPTAEAILVRSIEAQRPVGEADPTRSLQRYVALRRARASAAPPAVIGGGDGATVPPGQRAGWARDLLLRAAVDAAVARRTGDPVRRRDAWSLADPVLVRVHPSWLFVEPLTELLVTGAGLGRIDRVQPVVDAVGEQLDGEPRGDGRITQEEPVREGPGRDRPGCRSRVDGQVAAAFAWAQLHLALAVDDLDGAVSAVERLRAAADGSAHSRARAQAGEVWVRVAARTIDEADVVAAVDALLDVEEGWEAARLAGQAALDATDPMVTRRLLERARAAAPEPAPARQAVGGAEDGLVALGLSEREAEVARLVADGRTYKEIGAELYISAKTVEHHVARIRHKLGADSRAELLAVVRRHGSGGR